MYERKAQVLLKCNRAYYNVDDVKFVDIEEDIQGRDVMTFICPECEEEHRSLVFG